MKKHKQTRDGEANVSRGNGQDLRQRALRLLSGQKEDSNYLSATDLGTLIHELKVHQIEMEMQNEELRRAQLELEETHNRYRDLYNFAPVGYFTLDKNALILDANLTGSQLLGSEKRFLLCRRFISYIARENRENFYAYRKELLETKTERSREFTMIRQDGTPFFARMQGIAALDAEESLDHFRVAVLDITEQKRAEDALKNAFNELEEEVQERTRQLLKINEVLRAEISEREQAQDALKKSEMRYRAIVEDQTELICRWLPDGTLTFVNEAYCHYFGKEREELIGKSFMPLIPDEDHQKIKKHFASLDRENPIATMEHRVLKADGEVRWQQWTNRAILDEQGELVEFQSVGLDITEQKQAAEILRENLERLHKKNRYERIISNVTQAVHKSINLREVLQNTVESMIENIAEASHIGIYMVEGEEAVLKAQRGFPDWLVERTGRIPYPKGYTWKTIMDGKLLYCRDAEGDKVIGPAGKEVGTKSYLSIPICYQGRTVGCINIKFTPKKCFPGR